MPTAGQVGPDFPLMLDCYMALTVPYAIKLCNALAPHGLKWMEEFLPPDNYEGYKEVLQLHARCKLSTFGSGESSPPFKWCDAYFCGA